jgi:hypothetical protein
MASLIDGEPAPRDGVAAQRQTIDASPFLVLPRVIERPPVEFFDVLDARRSNTGGNLPTESLSSLLWHSMCLRERRPGRFGIGLESRSAPSAGGLHPIRLLVLPVDGKDGGIYDDHLHALSAINGAALELNRRSIHEILGVSEGTAVQFAVDAALVDACYENPSSLIWRDAGALAATMCLVAAALGLASTPVGRIGNAIVQAAGLPGGFVGAGAVHFGTLSNGPTAGYQKNSVTGELS